MGGNRSYDNFYLLASSNTCLNTLQNDHSLWHKWKGHVSHNSLRDTIVSEAIRGVPSLKGEPKGLCRPCQLGKQVPTSHLESQLSSTSGVLELVHMDLMGPMQVESIAGKRYVYVCVDDFSRFTWKKFLKSMSKAFEAFKYMW